MTGTLLWMRRKRCALAYNSLLGSAVTDVLAMTQSELYQMKSAYRPHRLLWAFDVWNELVSWCHFTY